MRYVLRGIDTISEWSGKGISMLIFPLVGIMMFEIVMRYAFNAPTNWAHETSQQIFGAYGVLVGAYVLRRKEHIKIDLIYTRFSPRVRSIFDSITFTIFLVFVGMMLVEGARMAGISIKVLEYSRSPWGPPIYPLKLMIPLGASLILLQGLANFIRSLSIAIRGRELA